MQSNHISKKFFLLISLWMIFNISSAANYTFELSNEQTWSDNSSTNTSVNYVTVRAYVPGSNSTTYRSVPIYTPTYTSEANIYGDVVGSVFYIYGSGTRAFVDPYDGPKRDVIYPATQILHTRLLAVNNERLAIGNYNVLGGHAAGKGFIYDIIYDQYTRLSAPDTVWTDLADINNSGQIVGTRINDDGATRVGFVYDCKNGYRDISIPDASWTIPAKIDDEGNIYGWLSGMVDAQYFIARPDSNEDLSSCMLVPRDDVTDNIEFASTQTFEMSGDIAAAVKVADFDGRGIDDLLIYHEIGKTILYLGEDGFDEKIKYYGDEFNTLSAGINLATVWDFNNDGLLDKISNNGTDNLLYFAKTDGGFYYVPQKLPAGKLYYGDLNGDGLLDIASFNGAYASVRYQTGQTAAVVEPVVTSDPGTNTDPVTTDAGTDTTPTTDPQTDAGTSDDSANSSAPEIDANASEVELKGTISEIHDNNVILSSGQTLWFNTDTIIKYNDANSFELGQDLEFKAWKNSDGALIGIKVEIP